MVLILTHVVSLHCNIISHRVSSAVAWMDGKLGEKDFRKTSRYMNCPLPWDLPAKTLTSTSSTQYKKIAVVINSNVCYAHNRKQTFFQHKSIKVCFGNILFLVILKKQCTTNATIFLFSLTASEWSWVIYLTDEQRRFC